MYFILLIIKGLTRSALFLHRITVGKNLNIVSSETTGPISVKFDVNDPWAVPYQIAVFYGLIPIRGLMRLLTVLHIKTMGET